MSPSRFQLEGSSLAEVTARAQAEFGPHAKIIAAEAVTTGGISGFFAQRHYEVTIEVPDDSAQDAHEFDLPARAGIAALLDEADGADLEIVTQTTPMRSSPVLSTNSVDFAAIMADLAFNTARPAPPAPPEQPVGPAPLAGAGDLVLVIGLGDDPLRIGRTMIGSAGDQALRTAGDLTVPGIVRVEDRRTLLAARASGVEGGHSIVVAFGLAAPGVDFARTGALNRLHADQVWLVIDASRKEADTSRWVAEVKSAVSVDGLIAFGREFTATPETAGQFGLPVGWAEGRSIG